MEVVIAITTITTKNLLLRGDDPPRLCTRGWVRRVGEPLVRLRTQVKGWVTYDKRERLQQNSHAPKKKKTHSLLGRRSSMPCYVRGFAILFGVFRLFPSSRFADCGRGGSSIGPPRTKAYANRGGPFARYSD